LARLIKNQEERENFISNALAVATPRSMRDDPEKADRVVTACHRALKADLKHGIQLREVLGIGDNFHDLPPSDAPDENTAEGDGSPEPVPEGVADSLDPN